jgi:hypothetical protein
MTIDTPKSFCLPEMKLTTPDQFNQVVSRASVVCYVDTTLTKDEMINSVKRYLDQWKDTPHQDRPLFAF